MKLDKLKRMGHRGLALVLALVLLMQAAPLAPVTANAEGIPETVVKTAESEAVTPETETADPIEETEAPTEEITDSTEETAAPSEETADPYALLASAETGNVEITSAEQLEKGIPEGSTYVLKNDIVMSEQQQIGIVAGTLDGKGHTITLNGKPLAKTVTGTVQNLNVAGTAVVYENEGAVVCKLSGGKVLNVSCSVQCDPKGGNLMGGIVGNSENGQILNCYFTGSGMGPDYFTIISGIMGFSDNDKAPSQMKNCYYTAGINAGGGYAWNRDDKCNGKKKLSEMKDPAFVALLNATNVGTGYIWAAADGALPKLVPGGTALEPCNKADLEAAIKEAQGKNESDYTIQSWASMQEALNGAKNIYQKFDATQTEVNDAAKALRDAVAALEKKEWEPFPVQLPEKGVIPISSQQDLSKIDGTDSTKYYRLTQDIVIDGNYFAPNLAGAFDGNGHTVTIRVGAPMFETITKTGVVQNLRIKMEGIFTNRQEISPFAKKLAGGMIVNCISEVTGQHSAGFVMKMEDGLMANCLTMGHNRRGALVFYQFSTDHRETNGYKSGKFHNCYWSASNSVENITPAENLINCGPVGDEELRSDDFIAKLNGQKGQYGVSWGRDVNGYPYLGEDHGNHVIDGSKNRYEVQFVRYDTEVYDVKNGELSLSPQMTNGSRIAGTFQLKDVPSDSRITWSCDDRANQEIMQIMDTGRLSIFHDGGAVVRAMEHKADGTEELAAELRVVSASREIEQLRVRMDGKVIDDTATVYGSENKVLEIQAKYAGAQDFETMPSYLVTVRSERPDLVTTDYNTAVFNFEKPGTSRITVTEKTQKENPVSVTVSITSQYVPVKSVKPAIGGTEKIHYRNSMGSGQFVSLPQSVIVEPANASYKNDFSIESSDPDIAEYSNASYTPYKNGNVTFTAKLNDNGKTVVGKSDVQFVYANPLTEVTGPSEPIVLEQGVKQILPLTFKGQPDNHHEVTEPDLVWTFDQKGIVSIQRPDVHEQVQDTGGLDDGNWVASKTFEVRGLKPGTVVATGTPVDTTGGAKPVTLTITVKGDGNADLSFDIPKFIETGKTAASAYFNANNTFIFGEEWSVFTLLRSGASLPKDQLDKYYSDVVNNARSWDAYVLATEVERTAIALNVMGKDITDVGGVNFVELICNHPDLTKQGSNSLAWALLALDMNATEIPADVKWTRERMIAEMLTYQNKDGGFGLDKNSGSGVDMTSMCVQALVRYQNQSEIAEAIEKAVGFLASAVKKNLNLGNAESISQIIITLAVLNRDLTKEPGFGDEVENLMSVLADYMVEGQGFKHTKNGGVDKMASAQAMQALCAYDRYLKGESGYWDLKGTGPIEDPATTVSKMIAALPEQVTAADVAAVKAARDAYEALTDAQKVRVQNLDKLQKAEKTLEELLAVKNVIDAIEALPETVTLENAGAVKRARDAFNRLTAQQQEQITNIQKLEAAEEALKKLATVESVMKMIDELPGNITLEDKNAVENARAAFEYLSKEQQEKVTNLEKLVKAEKKLEELESAQKVQQVVDAIDALPQNVTVQDEKAVQAARDAYEKLTEAQKAQVGNVDKLVQAEKSIADQKAAAQVEKLIRMLPDPVSLAQEQAVRDARSAYENLSDDQKALVTNLDKLNKAENDLEDLHAAQKVMAMIKNLPLEVTVADEQAVQAARSAYNALSAQQQKLVMNLYILERTEKALAEKKAVQSVVDAIEALPETVTKESTKQIKDARDAYNRLSPEQREQVGNLEKLISAEMALKALRLPGGKPGGAGEKESNVIEAVVNNGKVSAKQLEDIKGKDRILRIKGTMESGEKYVLSIHGKDVEKAEGLNVQMMRKGLHEEDIHKLSENPEIFRFLENGVFPCPMMVEMETKLADGEYLLLHYDPAQKRASLVSQVRAADGKVQFIVEEGGEYFLAKRASSKSVTELEQKTEVTPETQPQETQKPAEDAKQPAQQSSTSLLIWLPLVLVAVMAVVAIALKKRKEN